MTDNKYDQVPEEQINRWIKRLHEWDGNGADPIDDSPYDHL